MKELVDAATVRGLFASGVDAVRQHSEALAGRDWQAPACGDWTSAETARHVLAVSRWYHDWLDRALDGDLTRPFDGADIDRYNATELEELSQLTGPEAVAQFDISANNYLERLAAHWNVPYAYPYGEVTAGLHAGVAATEWHLHAWDLSTVTGRVHDPDDAKDLFLAAGACVAAAAGGIKRTVLSAAVPLAANRRPWRSLLKRSGRTPRS